MYVRQSSENDLYFLHLSLLILIDNVSADVLTNIRAALEALCFVVLCDLLFQLCSASQFTCRRTRVCLEHHQDKPVLPVDTFSASHIL